MKQLTLIRSGTPEGFEKRNTEIAHKASHGAISYAALAKEYHLTRERVRQIVAFQQPATYLQRSAAWKKRKRIENYGLCPKCGAVKVGRDVRSRRNYRLVNAEGRYCMSCARKIYRRKMTLRCRRCGKIITMPAGILLLFQSRGGYITARLSADGNTGTYVCLSCWRTGLERPEKPKIILTCRCGRTSKLLVKELLRQKMRGSYKSARLAQDGKTGTYLCLSCFAETRRGPKTPRIILTCRCRRESKITPRALSWCKARGQYKSVRLSRNGKTGTYLCLPCSKAVAKQLRAEARRRKLEK